MLEGTLQMNLPPEEPGHASFKFKVLVMYVFKMGCVKIQTEIGQMDSKDNKEHTGSLELPSSSC